MYALSEVQGSQERVRPPVKIFFGPAVMDGPAKTYLLKSDRLTISFRVTWVWSEGVNFYNRQIVIPSRKTLVT